MELREKCEKTRRAIQPTVWNARIARAMSQWQRLLRRLRG